MDRPSSIAKAKEIVIFKEVERQIDYQANMAAMLCTLIGPMKPEYLISRAKQLFSDVHRSLQPWLYSDVVLPDIAPFDNLDPEAYEEYYQQVVANARKIRELKKKQQEEKNARPD